MAKMAYNASKRAPGSKPHPHFFMLSCHMRTVVHAKSRNGFVTPTVWGVWLWGRPPGLRRLGDAYFYTPSNYNPACPNCRRPSLHTGPCLCAARLRHQTTEACLYDTFRRAKLPP
eukprot:343559-Pelagomonas_calceolata.AAC.3